MIKITFPDNSVKEYESGVTPLVIAESISPRLAQEVLVASVDGEAWDLMRPIEKDAALRLFKWEDAEGKHAFWHSSAHLLAEALQELYPGIKFGIGPAIENGFYYDVDPGQQSITSEDIPRIEARMLELAARKEAIVRHDISKADALKLFGDRNETYKVELIEELEDGKITTYTQGTFTDLCRGPHIPNTSVIKAVKITSLAGAYWRGDEKRNQLVRVYGISFPKKKCLMNILHCSRRLRSATIVSWVKNSNCLLFLQPLEPVFLCGYHEVLPFVSVLNNSCVAYRSVSAICKLLRLT